MSATYCVECGANVPGGSAFCPQCGKPAATTPAPSPLATPGYASPSQTPSMPSVPAAAPYVYQRPPTNGMATAGFVLSLVSLIFAFLVIPLILALVFSSLGISKAREFEEAGGQPIGRGLAVAGLVISIVVAFFWFLALVFSV